VQNKDEHTALPHPDDLDALLSALEDSAGPSPDLDALIGGDGCRPTADLDDAFATAFRLLPGWGLEHLGDNLAGTAGTLRYLGSSCTLTNGLSDVQGNAATRPLAVLAAATRALTRLRDGVPSRPEAPAAAAVPTELAEVMAELKLSFQTIVEIAEVAEAKRDAAFRTIGRMCECLTEAKLGIERLNGEGHPADEVSDVLIFIEAALGDGELLKAAS
jgi:hypothetical protein